MQKDNLFESLGKYRDFSISLNKDSEDDKKFEEENYFTEAFKIVLQNNPKFTKTLLLNIVEKNKKDKILWSKLQESDKFSVSRESFGNKRPDLKICLSDSTSVLIEIKLNSKQGKNQLNKYLKLGKYLLYITLHPERLEDKIIRDKNFVEHCRWYEIHQAVEEYLNKKNEAQDIYQNNFLLQEFKEFMEEKKMKPIDISGIEAFDEKIINTYDNLLELKSEILEKLKELELSELSTINVNNTEFDTDDKFLYFVVNLKKFPEDPPKVYYRIKFDNRSVSVRLTANDEFANEIIEKAQKCNFKTNDDEIYIDKSFDEIFNSKELQQEVILKFVVESIKKINNSGVLGYLK